jgi:hypothetical protein
MPLKVTGEIYFWGHLFNSGLHPGVKIQVVTGDQQCGPSPWKATCSLPRESAGATGFPRNQALTGAGSVGATLAPLLMLSPSLRFKVQNASEDRMVTTDRATKALCSALVTMP